MKIHQSAFILLQAKVDGPSLDDNFSDDKDQIDTNTDCLKSEI